MRRQGVMLTHANLRYQVDSLSYFLPLKAGERSLSLLPPWHIYERSCSYYILSRACCQAWLQAPFPLAWVGTPVQHGVLRAE